MLQHLNYISLTLLLVTCSINPASPPTEDAYFKDAVPCDSIVGSRIGAICKDGTYSKSTGSGTCSHHGGVRVWLCK
ncbi:DUF3761 domain-containing protein [Phaeocystidibacter marisrubri]|uniref:DUF3761 domain-containing protein n=1 Tax=Phaeocystidibacter marisrubri TaxID=1577780 RepID=A0A6L3ZGT4_9FLAO|nr:DUF3761 domain-containing protein [Phaeocystidibacter marisrubri]